MKNIINYIKKNKKKIILITSITLSIIITYAIFNDKITYLDESIHSYILSIRNDNLTSILLTITNMSSAYSLIVISILLLIILKNKRIPTYISLNLLFSYLANNIFKIIFSRPRPTHINLIEESGYSYPSGHAMISMAYFGFIAYILYKKLKNKQAKVSLIAILISTIILIGFSRIYLGVHYLSDVIGGFLFGLVYLIIYINNINLEKK